MGSTVTIQHRVYCKDGVQDLISSSNHSYKTGLCCLLDLGAL